MAETAKTKELVKAATKEPVKTIEKETKTPTKYFKIMFFNIR